MQNLSARYRELKSNNRHIIDNLKREKDTLLAQMEAMLQLLGEKLEKVVRALIQFARVLAYKTFTREHKEFDRLTSSLPTVMEDLEQPQRRGMRR